MEWLDGILKGIEGSEELAKKISKEIGTQFIPKATFNEVNEELKSTRKLMADQESSIKELGDKAKGSEEKDAIIKKSKEDLDAFKADADKRIANVKKAAVLQMKLSAEVDSSAVDLIAGLVDLDTVKMDGDKILNYDDIIKPIKEARGTLFKTTTITTPPSGGGGVPDSDNLSDTEFFTKMGLKPLK